MIGQLIDSMAAGRVDKDMMYGQYTSTQTLLRGKKHVR